VAAPGTATQATSTEPATDAAAPPSRPGAPDPALLTLAVEESLEAGDLDEARRRALIAATGHRAVGQFHAAMDACYQALAIMPSDPEIHLLLAELYLDRGWRGPAADKLVLLGRLSQLTGDGATRGRLCYLAAARFPDDPRLAAVCA
jgi:thioredoxin-like negative regulator of GroEL